MLDHILTKRCCSLNKNVSKDSRIFEETKANFMGQNFNKKIEQSGANQLEMPLGITCKASTMSTSMMPGEMLR